jgi:predicted DNA-binding transcriptional regulator YafY
MPRRRPRTNTETRLVRLYEMLLLFSRNRRGVTVAEVRAELGFSRATFYRELAVLEAAGVPIELDDGRYRFLKATELPSLGLTALQLASLQLARLQLAPLGGSLLLQELDQFLASAQPSKKIAKERQTSFDFAEPRRLSPPPKVVRALEKALSAKRRVCIEYCDRGGASSRVHIEPLVVRVAEAEPYVRAFCVERGDLRTYKLSRIQSAEVTQERATHPPDGTHLEVEGAVKVWSGAPRTVKLRLDASVARLAREYPLPHQTEHPNPDGSVTIRATVNGLVEVRPRILAWGAAAEVLEPKELRETVRAELAAALRKYDGPGPAKAKPEKSKGASRGSLKQGETRAG